MAVFKEVEIDFGAIESYHLIEILEDRGYIVINEDEKSETQEEFEKMKDTIQNFMYDVKECVDRQNTARLSETLKKFFRETIPERVV